MVDNDQVVEIGALAAAESAIILDIINFGQKGVPKKDYDDDDDDDDDDKNETLFIWLVKTVVKEAIKRKDTARVRLELENNIHTEFRANVKIVNVETGISAVSYTHLRAHET